MTAVASTPMSLWPARWRALSRISKFNRRNMAETEKRSTMHLVAMPIFLLNQPGKEQQSWRKYWTLTGGVTKRRNMKGV